MTEDIIVDGSVPPQTVTPPQLQTVVLLKPKVVQGSVWFSDQTVTVEAEQAAQWIAAEEAVAVETEPDETESTPLNDLSDDAAPELS